LPHCRNARSTARKTPQHNPNLRDPNLRDPNLRDPNLRDPNGAQRAERRASADVVVGLARGIEAGDANGRE
jgi:hypothetical protein